MNYRLSGLIIVSIVVSSQLLAACSTTPTSPATSQGMPAATRPYGNLTIAEGLGTIATLDPQIDSLGQSGPGAAIFDTLLILDSDNRLKPGIAERWEISPDGMTHTFYIRKGVRFHDGSDLTAADVKFSIERMMAPESTAATAPAWRNTVASVELKDAYTVVLHLKTPVFDPMQNSEGGMGAVLPKKYIEEKGVDYFRRNLVGSGPWKVMKYVRAERLELEAVEGHWRAVPKFKNITVMDVADMAVRVAMLKTGEVDLAPVGADHVPAVRSAGLRIYSYEPGRQYFIYVFYDLAHPEQYALGDVRVRKALQLATNNREIADKILGGYGAPYAVYNVSPSTYFFDPNVLKVDPYDPEGAKKLLTQAGYPDGFKTRIYDRVGAGDLNTVNLALSGYWRKIGVDAEIVPIQTTAVTALFRPTHKPEIWNSLLPSIGTPAIDFEKMVTAYHSTESAAKNIKNPRLDELIKKVPVTADPAEKKRLALEAAVLANNEYSILKLVTSHPILALGSKVGEIVGFSVQTMSGLTFETITHAK